MVVSLAKPALPARVNRNPKHPFKLKHKPWQLQPFLCAPVLPGETMSNLLLQSRVVTDPILDALGGWWVEYWFFYVKLTDLDAREDLQTALIDPDNADLSALKLGAVETWSYTAEGGIPWAKLCLKRVVEEWFRNVDETWNAAAIDNVPLVAISEDKGSWAQSLVMADDMIALDVAVSTAGDNAFTMSELETARREYELLKLHGLSKMSWEDYLTQAGVRTGLAEDPHRPELLRHVREWSYPTNTIDPTNGTPRSAVSWAVAERADKARFFSEPGFILGVTCARPKVFMRAQVGQVAGFMDSAQAWLPPMLQDDAWSSLTTHVTTAGSGPVPGITDAQGYTWDMRDLFLYGEQFLNFDPTAATGQNLVDLPTAAALKEYVDEDDINSIFVSGTADLIKQDGIVHLTIKGRQRDTTPPPGGAIA